MSKLSFIFNIEQILFEKLNDIDVINIIMLYKILFLYLQINHDSNTRVL